MSLSLAGPSFCSCLASPRPEQASIWRLAPLELGLEPVDLAGPLAQLGIGGPLAGAGHGPADGPRPPRRATPRAQPTPGRLRPSPLHDHPDPPSARLDPRALAILQPRGPQDRAAGEALLHFFVNQPFEALDRRPVHAGLPIVTSATNCNTMLRSAALAVIPAGPAPPGRPSAPPQRLGVADALATPLKVKRSLHRACPLAWASPDTTSAAGAVGLYLLGPHKWPAVASPASRAAAPQARASG